MIRILKKLLGIDAPALPPCDDYGKMSSGPPFLLVEIVEGGFLLGPGSFVRELPEDFDDSVLPPHGVSRFSHGTRHFMYVQVPADYPSSTYKVDGVVSFMASVNPDDPIEVIREKLLKPPAEWWLSADPGAAVTGEEIREVVG